VRLEPPYGPIASGLDLGEVVPFFGSAASAICRPEEDGLKWGFRKPFFPFGGELADKLARDSSYYSSAEAGQDVALNELLDAAAKVAPGVKLDDFREAFKPVVERHVGTPPLALIASFFARVQSTRRNLDRQLRETFSVKTDPGPLQTSCSTQSARPSPTRPRRRPGETRPLNGSRRNTPTFSARPSAPTRRKTPMHPACNAPPSIPRTPPASRRRQGKSKPNRSQSRRDEYVRVGGVDKERYRLSRA
jgi:hypothetical protein